MNGAGKLTLSAALIILVCFFLPWVQVSCGGTHDASSGLNLARGGDTALWLIPVLMLVLILFGLGRLSAAQRLVFGFIGSLSGLVSCYLMNHERMRFAESSGLLAVRLTGWFWLSLLCSVAIVVSGFGNILRRPRASE